MADTLEFALTDDAWTDISTTAGAAGYITNGSDATILYTQQESPPAITITVFHRLQPGADVNYSIIAPEVIYARSTDPHGKLVVTPGTLT